MIEYENLNRLNASFEEEFKASFDSFLKTGWYILGTQVSIFEREFSDYCSTPHFVGVASGLDALLLSLKALELPMGSEVIVPSNTYIATVLAILQAGLKPVLVEPDIRTYNIDPAKIEEAISSVTSAIIVVHLYGKPCVMDKIMDIANRRNIPVIEDCAQAHGASFNERKVGTFGQFGAFSFYPTKNLGALGDAGGISTRTENHAATLRRLRNYGSDRKYYNELVGYNSRLDELQAGFLSIKLKHLDRINTHKRQLAGLYFEGLKNDFIKPVVEARSFDVYHIFNVRHERRDALRDYLLKNEIRTEIHYPVSPNRQKAMKGILNDRPLPISEEIHRTTLSLPISFHHSEEDVRRVVEVMNRF